MKLTQTLMIGLSLALASAPAFAGAKDLKIYRTLLKVGAQTEQFMSQAHLGLDGIDCYYSFTGKDYACHMTDIAAAEGQGAELQLNGRKAAAVFAILENAGAPSDNGMGKIYLSARSIRCTQAVKGVGEGSEAARTACTIDVSTEE